MTAGRIDATLLDGLGWSIAFTQRVSKMGSGHYTCD